MPRGIPTSGRALVLKPPVEPDPLESWHQEQVMRLAALNRHFYPELEWLHSVPNGGFRHKATAVAMERQGAKSGISDLALDVARGGYLGLKLELKRFREGKPTEKQQAYLAFCRAQGYRALVCWGWRVAWDEITGYLSLPPTCIAD